MIKKLKLKYGAIDAIKTMDIEIGSTTLFIGPNNSGKSLLLREVEKYLIAGPSANQLLLDSLEIQEFSLDNIKTAVYEMSLEAEPHENIPAGSFKYGRVNASRSFSTSILPLENLFHWQQNKSAAFFAHFVKNFVSRFGGKERFGLVADQGATDLKKPPQSILMSLFQNNDKRGKVRELLWEAFGKYFVIDMTNPSKLEIRFSEVSPLSEGVEKGWTEASVAFHKAAKSVHAMSDGVQAFTGLVMAVVAGEEKAILIDEPEAFLHPSLANLLGKKLSQLMAERDGNLVVATHSPFFLLGCLQSGKKITIVRLSHDVNEGADVRVLKAEDVSVLFKNPLLRSVGAVQALFYSHVVVTEGDADRAFYNEVNERMITANKGVSSCLFLNAQNKQTVWDIVKPLREMGIPAVGIVDIDFLKNGGVEFTKALAAVGVPEGLHESFGGLRSKLKATFDAIEGKDMKRHGGKSLLGPADLEVYDKFSSDLASYGLFIVPFGELESWLKKLHCAGHGPQWLREIFSRMGEDPAEASYLHAGEDDVWAFWDLVRQWSVNPKRKGVK